MFVKNTAKRMLTIIVVFMMIFMFTESAFALDGNMSGTVGSSGSGSGTGDTSGVACRRQLPTWDNMRNWVFGADSLTPTARRAASGLGYFYDVADISGDGEWYYRGNDNVTDHWNIFIVGPNVNDKEANGAKDNTTATKDNATLMRVWAAEDVFHDTPSGGYHHDNYDEGTWHSHYWNAHSHTAPTPNNNGAFRAIKNDYGTGSGSDPHNHFNYAGGSQVAVTRRAPIVSGRWWSGDYYTTYDNVYFRPDDTYYGTGAYNWQMDDWAMPAFATFKGGWFHNVNNNLGYVTNITGSNNSPSDPPRITINTGVAAFNLSNFEGRYALFGFTIDNRGDVQGSWVVDQEIVQRPRIRVHAWVDTNNDGNYDSGEELSADQYSWNITLPSNSVAGAAYTSSYFAGNTIAGQDANGNAYLHGQTAGSATHPLYPAPINHSSWSTTAKAITGVPTSAGYVTANGRWTPIASPGYTINIDIDDGYQAYANANVPSINCYLDGSATDIAPSITGSRIVTVDYATSTYKIAGRTSYADAAGNVYYPVNPNDTAQFMFPGCRFGYTNESWGSGDFDGGTYDIWVRVKPKTRPVQGWLYFDKNKDGDKDADEPWLQQNAVNPVHTLISTPVDPGSHFPENPTAFSRMVDGGPFTIRTYSRGVWDLQLNPGRDVIAGNNLDWVVTGCQPASASEIPDVVKDSGAGKDTIRLDIPEGDTPIIIYFGCWVDTELPPMPTDYLNPPNEWMDTGRAVTVKVEPPALSNAGGSWTAVHTMLWQPYDKTWWDWVYYQKTPNPVRQYYKVLSADGAIGVQSEPQMWLAANAEYGLNAATRAYWGGDVEYATKAAALAQKPTWFYNEPAPYNTVEITERYIAPSAQTVPPASMSLTYYTARAVGISGAWTATSGSQTFTNIKNVVTSPYFRQAYNFTVSTARPTSLSEKAMTRTMLQSLVTFLNSYATKTGYTITAVPTTLQSTTNWTTYKTKLGIGIDKYLAYRQSVINANAAIVTTYTNPYTHSIDVSSKVDENSGINYYCAVLYEKERINYETVIINGEAYLNPTVTYTYKWGVDADNTKVYTAKPRY